MIILIKYDRYFDSSNVFRTNSRFIFLKMPRTGLSLGAASRALESEGKIEIRSKSPCPQAREKPVLRHQIGGWGVG
jgi:hypothetical protein